MGRFRDLLMFTNPADFRRALNDPQKTARVLKSTVLQTSSSTERIDNPAEEIRRTIHRLFGNEGEDIESLFEKAEEFEEEEITPRVDVFSELSFGPGGMSIGGKALYVLTRLTKPESIVEIGVANGMSTAYILGALDDEGIDEDAVTIHAIDRPQFAHQIRERRGRFGLEGRGGIIPDRKEVGWLAPNRTKQKYNYQLHVGDFTHILDDILELSDGLDLAIYDASKDPEEMRFAYDRCLERLQDGGILVSDDVLVNDTFENLMDKRRGDFEIINDTGIYKE